VAGPSLLVQAAAPMPIQSASSPNNTRLRVASVSHDGLRQYEVRSLAVASLQVQGRVTALREPLTRSLTTASGMIMAFWVLRVAQDSLVKSSPSTTYAVPLLEPTPSAGGSRGYPDG
jgi:hypothetical protein